MKKILVIVATVVFIALIASACHGSKKCPAYSKAETEQQDLNS